jgi:cytidylate kinase
MKVEQHLNALLASIRTGLYAQQRQGELAGRLAAPPVEPFITISRQAGAGGRTVARLLADRLNIVNPGERPWAVWDRELVEKVSVEQHIPESLVESLEHPRPWMEQFLAGLSPREDPEQKDEFLVYRRVATTVRGLARAGRAIIVGRGGVYATSDLPSGVHVRLIAPLDRRVANMARLRNMSPERATAEVRRLDRDRDAFHHRYWRGKALVPEVFTVTLNTAAMTDEQMIACILPLIPVEVRRTGATAEAGQRKEAQGVRV